MSKLPPSHVWWADCHRFTRLIISSSFPTSFRSLQCNYSARRPLALKFLICVGRGRAFLASFILFCCCRTMPRKVTDFNDFFLLFYSWFLCVHVGRAHVTHKYLYKILFPCIILRFLIIPPQRVKEVRNRLVSSFDCFPHGFQTTNPDHQLTFWMMKMLHIPKFLRLQSSCGCSSTLNR